MDWKTMKEIIDEMVEVKVKVKELEIEVMKLREDKEKLKEEIGKLNEEKDNHLEFYRKIRSDVVSEHIDIDNMVNEALTNDVIDNVEEIKTVIVEDTEENKRKTYMRNYMKEKRKSDKDAK